MPETKQTQATSMLHLIVDKSKDKMEHNKEIELKTSIATFNKARMKKTKTFNEAPNYRPFSFDSSAFEKQTKTKTEMGSNSMKD